MAKPDRGASGRPPGPADVDAACQTLADLRRRLTQTLQSSGSEPSEDVLSTLADDCPDAVIVCTAHAEIRVVNRAAVKLTGYSIRELQTLTVWDLTPAAAQADFDVLWREFLRAGRQRGVYSLRRRDGSAIEAAYCAETRFAGELSVAILRHPNRKTAGSLPA
jgi:PAS domain S-box-containing protein